LPPPRKKYDADIWKGNRVMKKGLQTRIDRVKKMLDGYLKKYPNDERLQLMLKLHNEYSGTRTIDRKWEEWNTATNGAIQHAIDPHSK
jgi:hypothetical protein